MAEAEDLMRYDLLTQDALRGVVRLALRRVAREGLPGQHHFFIAIDTRHPGVELSARLRGKYPDEITIVLQHQFWNLDVQDQHFSVDLSFDNITERLNVPFAAVKGFFDPAVQFGLQFEAAAAKRPAESASPAPEEKTRGRRKTDVPAALPKDQSTKEIEPAAAKVVSLDTFRKK